MIDPFLSIVDGIRFVAFVFFFDGGSLGATSNHKRGFGGMEKKVKEELGPRSLEIHAIGYLVDFEANGRSI